MAILDTSFYKQRRIVVCGAYACGKVKWIFSVKKYKAGPSYSSVSWNEASERTKRVIMFVMGEK